MDLNSSQAALVYIEKCVILLLCYTIYLFIDILKIFAIEGDTYEA